jgi:hypothetical protein
LSSRFALTLFFAAVIEPASYDPSLGLVCSTTSNTENLSVHGFRRQRYLHGEFSEQIRTGPGKPYRQVVNRRLYAPQFQPTLNRIPYTKSLRIERWSGNRTLPQ